MTEDEARAWFTGALDVSRETLDRLDRFARMVVEENDRQNLISATTVQHLWARHMVDSAQLLTLGAHMEDGAWLDLGSGPGFPGMVIAILRDQPMLLVEERRRRHEFLVRAADALGLRHVSVKGARLEAVGTVPVSVITARAFAPLPRLLAVAHRFSTEKTLWLLPKGRSAREELESVRGAWHGAFHVEPSITDAEAAIIVATGVRPRKTA